MQLRAKDERIRRLELEAASSQQQEGTKKASDTRRAKGAEKSLRSSVVDDSSEINVAGEDRALRIRGIITGILNRLTTW